MGKKLVALLCLDVLMDGVIGKDGQFVTSWLIALKVPFFCHQLIHQRCISKTADKVLEMLDAVADTVGEDHVVQIVTDNAANYKAAGEILMLKRKKLYWAPCAVHCIDLMLEDLDKIISVRKVTIAKGRKITTFIYSRTLLLTWMKEFTKNRELIRPRITRFATSYLKLRCLNDLKGPLLVLFSSGNWNSRKFVKSNEAGWCDSYGDECPKLQRFAIRILCLTCVASGCERKWSAFEMLKRRHEKRSRMSIIQRPITLDDLPSDDEWMVETEEPVLSSDETWITNLDRAAGLLAREARRNEDEINDDEMMMSTGGQQPQERVWEVMMLMTEALDLMIDIVA